MNYLKSSFENYVKSYRGSITGSFFDLSTINFDENIEINYSKLPANFSAPRHFHAHSKTWVLVIKGAMYFKIEDEEVVVKAGEFLIFTKGVKEEVLRVDEGTESITIHSPSVKGGDKVSI